MFPETTRIGAMGLFTKDIKTMNDLFVHQLQDIYYAENQLVKALPKMAEKAADQQLKQGFLTHLEETRTHVSGWSRSSGCTVPRSRRSTARRSTASSRKPTKSPARSLTSPCWTQR